MSSRASGHFLGGAATSRDRRESRELEARRLGIAERQFEAEQRAELLQRTRDQIAALSEQATGLVSNLNLPRDDERFASTLAPLREAVATLAARGEELFPGSMSAQSQLSLFDSTVSATPTILEAAEAEAEATVAGATAQASAIRNLAPEQRAEVEQILGLTEDGPKQEFFGLLELLEDPNASPLAKEMAGQRMEAITSNNQSQLIVSADRDGNITVAQGPNASLPSRMTLGAGQLDQLRGARDIIVRGRELSQALTANTDTALGAMASLRRGAQTVTGVISDVTGIPVDQVTQEFERIVTQVPHDSPTSFSVGEIDAAEGILMFAVARALQGDSNRLLAGSLERARELTRLTGLTSEEQVRDRLNFINQFLTSQEANFQRRLEQGVSGTATTEREPVTPTEAGSGTEEDLLRRFDALLGEGGG